MLKNTDQGTSRQGLFNFKSFCMHRRRLPFHTHHENTFQKCCRDGQQQCMVTGKSLEKGYGEKLKSYPSNSISVTSFEVWNSKPRRFGTYRVHGRTACSSLAKRPMGSRIIRRRCKWRRAQWKLAVLWNIITNGRSFRSSHK